MTPAKKVLVLEDEVIVAMDLAQCIEEDGHKVLGPYHTLETVVPALDADWPDCAVLDLNLGNGATSDPVAEKLAGRTPLLFLTGDESAGPDLLDRFPDALYLPKPLLLDRVLEWIRGI